MANPLPLNVDNLKTGDIILFSGRCFVSRVVRFVSRSKWSHVGMVIIDPAYPLPLIYESSHSTKLDGLDLGKETAGVQLLFLEDRIDTFRGDMALRRLEGHTLSPEDRKRLVALRKELVGVPFENSWWQMAQSELKTRIMPRRSDLSSIFCSELIAHCYQELGLLGLDTPSNMFSPTDFSSERELPLLKGSLGPHITIKTFIK